MKYIVEKINHPLVDNEHYLDSFARLTREHISFVLNLFYVHYLDEEMMKIIVEDEPNYLLYDYSDFNNLDDMNIWKALSVHNKKYGTALRHSVFDSIQICILFKNLTWFFDSRNGVRAVLDNTYPYGFYFIDNESIIWFIGNYNLKKDYSNEVKKINADIGYYNPFNTSALIYRRKE